MTPTCPRSCVNYFKRLLFAWVHVSSQVILTVRIWLLLSHINFEHKVPVACEVESGTPSSRELGQ